MSDIVSDIVSKIMSEIVSYILSAIVSECQCVSTSLVHGAHHRSMQLPDDDVRMILDQSPQVVHAVAFSAPVKIAA